MNAEGSGGPELLIFRLAERDFAVPLARVREIVRMVALTPVPDSPQWFLGVMNLRGSQCLVIDLAARLSMPSPGTELTSRIVVVDGLARSAGLVVDEVTEVVTRPPDSVTPLDTVTDQGHPVLGVARVGSTTVVILDIDAITAGTADLAVPENLDAGV